MKTAKKIVTAIVCATSTLAMAGYRYPDIAWINISDMSDRNIVDKLIDKYYNKDNGSEAEKCLLGYVGGAGGSLQARASILPKELSKRNIVDSLQGSISGRTNIKNALINFKWIDGTSFPLDGVIAFYNEGLTRYLIGISKGNSKITKVEFSLDVMKNDKEFEDKMCLVIKPIIKDMNNQ